MSSRVQKARAYWQAIAPIFVYSAVSGAVLYVLSRGMDMVAKWMMASQGRVAVTTGDFMFVFTTWQGWVMILLGALAIYLYMALNINAPIALSERILIGEKAQVFGSMSDGLKAMPRFFNPWGLVVVLYIAFIVPLVGVGVSISLTENLRIPTFIANVIEGTPILNALYLCLLVVAAFLGVIHIFAVHGVVLDDMGVGDSLAQSRALMRKHWKNYLWEMLRFTLTMIAVGIFIVLLASLVSIACVMAGHAIMGGERPRLETLFLVISVVAVGSFIPLVFVPYSIIKTTQLFRSYQQGSEVQIVMRNRHTLPFLLVGVVGIYAIAGVVAFALNESFDVMFPAEVKTNIIAHRGGGHEAPENSVEGIRVAGELHSWGSEIDIQRTSDGYYIVNHDDDLKRVTGDPHKSYELTLEQVRQLRIGADASKGVEGVMVPTYEEALDAAYQSGVYLLVELKGATADQQMADDAVRIAKERGVLDNCIFISLKYHLIDYLENTYDVKTGFLAFGSYGDLSRLNCDYLALEELATTDDVIDAVHEQGKGVFVWTLNNEEQQQHFFRTDADAIITDSVVQANELKASFAKRDDLTRIVDWIISLF